MPVESLLSNRDGAFEIHRAENVHRGAKIVLRLKENAKEFANAKTIEDIVKRYSNFLSFPIFLNGKQVRQREAGRARRLGGLRT